MPAAKDCEACETLGVPCRSHTQTISAHYRGTEIDNKSNRSPKQPQTTPTHEGIPLTEMEEASMPSTAPCPLAMCYVPGPHGHGTDQTYDGGDPQPACGDPKPHGAHNGFATFNPKPWCKGVEAPMTISLHTGDPGIFGEDNVAPGYPRQKLSWSAAGSGPVTFSSMFIGSAREPDMPDFVEDTNSVRGPGWGVRYCPYCDHETFGGLESVTEDAMWEHLEVCPELHPVMPTAPSSPGTFDAALYAAFVAGGKARHRAGFEMRMMSTPEDFLQWRSQWHGEWSE